MAKIDGKSFTVIAVEDSHYTEGDKVTKGVKITTKEKFDIEDRDGPTSKFHTTRIAVVNKFDEKLRADIAKGIPIGPVKCKASSTKDGKKFFDLVDA